MKIPPKSINGFFKHCISSAILERLSSFGKTIPYYPISYDSFFLGWSRLIAFCYKVKRTRDAGTMFHTKASLGILVMPLCESKTIISTEHRCIAINKRLKRLRKINKATYIVFCCCSAELFVRNPPKVSFQSRAQKAKQRQKVRGRKSNLKS